MSLLYPAAYNYARNPAATAKIGPAPPPLPPECAPFLGMKVSQATRKHLVVFAGQLTVRDVHSFPSVWD